MQNGIQRRPLPAVNTIELFRNIFLPVMRHKFGYGYCEQGTPGEFFAPGKIIRRRKNIVWNGNRRFHAGQGITTVIPASIFFVLIF